MEQFYSQQIKCPVSGSEDLEIMPGYEHDYLVKSKPLGFVFCSRIPSEQELLVHYEKYNRNEYYSPVTRIRYRELLGEFEPFRKTNKILDMGCGTGFFLEEAKAKGWEVYGTELSESAIKICETKGITMQKISLSGGIFNDGMFDVITSFEVVEHINNPLEMVKDIHKVSRKGGLVYLTTPNFNAVERYILKNKYSIIEYPEHLVYFTAKTLNYLFTKNGFRAKKIKTTGISFSRLKLTLTKDRNIENNEIFMSEKSTDEIIRNKTQSNIVFRILLKIANGLLDFFKVGNSLKAWFIKE